MSIYSHRSERTWISEIFLVTIFVSPIGHAGDEDMNPTAYHQFDPVTGYMFPIENPPPTKQNHTPLSAANTIVDATITVDPLPNEPQDTGQGNLFWLYLFSALTIFAGFAAWIGKKRNLNNSNLD